MACFYCSPFASTFFDPASSFFCCFFFRSILRPASSSPSYFPFLLFAIPLLSNLLIYSCSFPSSFFSDFQVLLQFSRPSSRFSLCYFHVHLSSCPCSCFGCFPASCFFYPAQAIKECCLLRVSFSIKQIKPSQAIKKNTFDNSMVR